MNNCGSEYVTPNRAHPHYDDHSPPDHRRPHPHYDDQNPPDHRYYNVEPKVKLKRSAVRKKLNFYQETLQFGQAGSSFRPWKQGEKSKFSPYLKNKVNGRYQPLSHQSPKVKSNSFL